MSQDELKKALQTARFAHERETELTYTITGFGALLRAVEILVERQDKPAEADSGIVAKLEQKIKMQHAEMGEARARVAELEREQRECVEALSESLLVMPGRTLIEAVKDLIELYGSAKPVQSPPDTSTESGLPDAQTPGQVGLAAWNAKFVEQHGGDIVAWENESMEAREREEASARAVLDVYGKRMVREALRKGLHRIQGMGAQPSEETFKADVIAALNEEIAELASVPSRPDVVLREMS